MGVRSIVLVSTFLAGPFVFQDVLEPLKVSSCLLSLSLS